MDLENIMLNELNQRQQKPYDLFYMWNLKIKRKTKQNQAHRHTEQVDSSKQQEEEEQEKWVKLFVCLFLV